MERMKENEQECFDVYKFATGYLPDEGCVEKEKERKDNDTWNKVDKDYLLQNWRLNSENGSLPVQSSMKEAPKLQMSDSFPQLLVLITSGACEENE